MNWQSAQIKSTGLTIVWCVFSVGVLCVGVWWQCVSCMWLLSLPRIENVRTFYNMQSVRRGISGRKLHIYRFERRGGGAEMDAKENGAKHRWAKVWWVKRRRAKGRLFIVAKYAHYVIISNADERSSFMCVHFGILFVKYDSLTLCAASRATSLPDLSMSLMLPLSISLFHMLPFLYFSHLIFLLDRDIAPFHILSFPPHFRFHSSQSTIYISSPISLQNMQLTRKIYDVIKWTFPREFNENSKIEHETHKLPYSFSM